MPAAAAVYHVYEMSIVHRAAVQSIVLALSSIAGPGMTHAQSRLDHRAIAEELVRRADVQRGERVLLVAAPGPFDALIVLLRQRLRAAGATELGVLSTGGSAPADWETSFARAAAGRERGALVAHLAAVDLAIMMPGATPNDIAYGAMQDVLRVGRGRTIHFHWAGAYAIDGSVMEVNATVDSAYQHALLRTDYGSLAASMSAFEEAMRGSEVRVTTPEGTDLRFRIGDRPVTKQDGDAGAARARSARNLIDREIELPAGAIRVAPVEGTVNGRIVFPSGQWAGERVEGLVMTVVRGRVTRFEATTGREAVERELTQAGGSGRSFREFALGFNPLLAIPRRGQPWIPYYGYGAGVVRLSLGDNSELGGAVRGGYVRWNFFIDATVTVGPDTWVRNGQLIR